MDMEGTDKDVKVMIMDDDKVYIQQHCPRTQRVDVIDMDWQMLYALSKSLDCSPGLYSLKGKEVPIIRE